MNDQLDFQLEPDKCEISMQQMPPLNNPSLRTSGRLRVKSIKKYLLQKLGLKDAPSSVRHFWNFITLSKIVIVSQPRRDEKVTTNANEFMFFFPFQIEVLCNGDPIGDELSLTFILRTRWFNPNKILTLKYRLSEEFAVSQRKFDSTGTDEVT